MGASVLRTHTKICARGVVSASPSSSRPRVTSEESEGCELENSVDTTNTLQGGRVGGYTFPFSHHQNNCVVTRNYFARASLPNRSDAESAAWRALRERTVSARSRVDAAWTKKQIERAGWDFEGDVCHL